MRLYTTGSAEPERPLGAPIGEAVRILRNLEVAPNGCWLPQRKAGSRGYTYFVRDDGRKQVRHRATYEILVGPVPDGLQLDHLCHNTDESCAGGWTCPHRKCVNPAHLEPVTQSVNLARGRSGDAIAALERAKTHCPSGHAYDRQNTYISKATGGRICRTCNRERNRAKSRRSRGLPDPRRKITDQQIADVLRLSAEGVAGAEISRRLGISGPSVSRIRNGKQRTLP